MQTMNISSSELTYNDMILSSADNFRTICTVQKNLTIVTKFQDTYWIFWTSLKIQISVQD